MQTTDGSLPSDANNSPSIVNSLQCDVNAGINKIIYNVKYSKYSKLLRVTAYIFRFINNCQKKTRLINELTSAELDHTERRWLKSCQENTYPDEITSLKSKKSTRLPLMKQLRLFVDSNGKIRSGGGIHNAQLSHQISIFVT